MTALLVMSVCLVSCQQNELIGELPAAREGYVALRFSADIPVMETQNVSTRSVDPDGGGVQTMTLFCFDNYGSFITTVKADLSPTDDLTGNFTAEVPEIHGGYILSLTRIWTASRKTTFAISPNPR